MALFLACLVLCLVSGCVPHMVDQNQYCTSGDDCSKEEGPDSRGSVSLAGDEDDFLAFRPALENLDAYIAEHLQPTKQFNQAANEKVDALCAFFRSTHFKWKVSRVDKGGSLGKGTHVKGKSDIDLVIFLNGFQNHQEFLDKRKDVRAKIEPCLKQWNPGLLKVVGSSPGGWQVRIRTTDRGEYMEGDLLLAVDNLKRLDKPVAVYEEIVETKADFYGYTYSLNQLQVNFIQQEEKGIPRSPKLKNLIRLVKKWRDQYLTKGMKNAPVNYALELLTVYSWEKACHPQNFNTKICFRGVLETLTDYNKIYAVWQVNYEFETFKSHIDFTERPLILDPANPFYNVAKGPRGFYNWAETSRRATKALQAPLFSV